MTQEFVTLPREVVERALEALKYEKDANNPLDWHHDKTMNALRASLEQPQVEQEPVAKVVLTEQLGLPCLQWLDLDRQFDFKGGELLYTHPQPKREPLTDAEIGKAARWLYQDHLAAEIGLEDDIAVARAIEAAHNIK